jgi:hypothetical protein
MSSSLPDPLSTVIVAGAPRGLSADARFYLKPQHLLAGLEAAEAVSLGQAQPLADTTVAFAGVRVLARGPRTVEAFDVTLPEVLPLAR